MNDTVTSVQKHGTEHLAEQADVGKLLAGEESVKRPEKIVIRSRAPGRSPQGEGWSPFS